VTSTAGLDGVKNDFRATPNCARLVSISCAVSAVSGELTGGISVGKEVKRIWEAIMGFGRGALLWLLGVPLPIIILLALFWHH
jgi:hypothetical protein